ncbi:MAG: polyribonucleotide nucleotidyltransferase [Nitrospira sp.]|jgi:polyribonucleotide nucleotidyltransferase|uniref:polyribonucleotide nucleotidyltransferase n=1 Tax=Nitrospira sp. ND1 TaxID=1658518 RepID=UPI0009B95B05|nr:polyribonucleotide nucleotidyltransferase [Nitrospira sp. ND1]MBK7418120.1 polyribonucleotide nucleotidyltransferase [Nitrospira sp.]MBK7484660.1 polyribonucleotide nucleotidyltransferase [Nitrospira sp.]MBK8376898.1 polyribonucleotide nucleotidyltransferase [Nitrospira sp.]MBP6198247.1 polyribonucleotide nucleotidyltransferase [Nitrospira sp.]MBP8199178.1 polyribonucleotide nucleotidyltransferase [Nitrospira sp.]
MKHVVGIELAGRRLTLETGRIAKQADGAIWATYGDTVVLATAVASQNAKPGVDFLPLTVDYQERTYAAGKIPGGYFKREGRPSEREVLTSRLIDRPLRPLFPEGYYFETQVIASVLSADKTGVSDVIGIIAASAALAVSSIPFNGPIAGVKIGRVNGQLVVNPDLETLETSDLHLVVAGTADAVMMVEAGANELPEATMLEAIELAHSEIKKIVAKIEELRKLAGKPKRTVLQEPIDAALTEQVRALVAGPIREAILIPNKSARQERLDQVLAETVAKLKSDEPNRDRHVKIIFHGLEYTEVRNMILEKRVRADGRGPADIRPITCEVGVLPRAHGSAVFTRGETQSLAVVTLGTTDDEQRIDALEGEYMRTFMLHYNFPPFSVGEARPLRSPGRREVGHGALAERALKSILPGKDKFPYTVRIVSEILESNGSSSMATVCGGTLALLDAGVPIKEPVAGIAMGLIKEGNQVLVLSDILGLEDHLGDMDFKVTGTKNGVTALQMDIKIGGITSELMREALAQAKAGRLHILGCMAQALTEPRTKLSAFAPRIFPMKIKQDKIRDVIGPGGKMIRSIIAETGVKINVEDTGDVTIASSDEASAQKAIDMIKRLTEEVEVGKIYLGTVRKIMDFGAFVEVLPGTDGLVHISQLAHHRVKAVTDEVSEGDQVMVKVLEIDKQGKIRLSRKEAMPAPAGSPATEPTPAG